MRYDPLLWVENLQGWYGESHILHGVNLSAQRAQTIAILGRNGVGKTSTLRGIVGLLSRATGSIRMNGTELIGMPRHRIAYTGIGYVPEERGIYASLSVQENLDLLPKIGDRGMSLDRIFDLFPNLKERRRAAGGTLSGGEQQMLSIARVLRAGPELLVLDEPTEGLSPVIVQHIGRVLNTLKKDGLTMLLVEQNFHFARHLADHFYIMEEGRVVDDFPARSLDARLETVSSLIGV
jgi:branched-chain amino acid transport system ATP-binding protein